MQNKTRCVLCNKEGITFLELAKAKLKIFNSIPIKDIINEWYKKGYKKTDAICGDCFLK